MNAKSFLMENELFKKYIITTLALVKALARKAKTDADNPKNGFEDYNEGAIMGYYSIITLLKHEAFVFCIDQKELGLEDIQPDIDLLDLHRNPDIDSGADNWTIDIMSEEKIKGYLSDSISLLKEQAREAKKDAENPEEGFEAYNKGALMAYSSVFSLFKSQASIFNIDEKELHLSDLKFE